jgi:hypothetical protein
MGNDLVRGWQESVSASRIFGTGARGVARDRGPLQTIPASAWRCG